VSTTHRVHIQDCESGQFVEAILHERVDTDFASRADNAWLTYLAIRKAQLMSAGKIYDRPDYWHWRWEEKVSVRAHLLSTPTLGVERNGDIEGLMMLLTDGEFCRLPQQAKMPLVYVYYIASAPWNLPQLGTPKYRGIGTVLLKAAVQMSLDLGFKGRIALHSLPRAEAFYERHGMKAHGIDPHKEHLKYYEMTAEAAKKFLD
jgi:hypothetical protein